MGTFMSKHCSPMSYGTPLEKKSCANYGYTVRSKALLRVEISYKKSLKRNYHLMERDGPIKLVILVKTNGKLYTKSKMIEPYKTIMNL
jgi:hypothetical protein